MKKKGEIKMATERRGHRQREKKDSEQEKRDRETKKGSDLDKETKKGPSGEARRRRKSPAGERCHGAWQWVRKSAACRRNAVKQPPHTEDVPYAH